MRVFFATLILFTAQLVGAATWWEVSGALDFTPHGTQPTLTHALIASSSCSGCHASNSGTNPTFQPYNTWSGSMMANATRDPLFWAALDIANHDVPGVGDYCLRCHTPTGWYGGRVVKTGIGTVDGSNGCLLTGDHDDPDDFGNDYGGATCHFCHRLVPTGPADQPALIGNANVQLDDAPCPGSFDEPCRRGPYDYTDGNPTPPHPWAHSAYLGSSAMCGSCHDVTTPDTSAGPLRTLRTAAGVDSGLPFPVERTYSEWSQSLFADLIFRDSFGDPISDVPALVRGESCQQCHMPISDDPGARACSFCTSGSRAGELPIHELAGGNAWMPQVLKGEYGAALNREVAFDQTTAAARRMLSESAALALTKQTYTAPTPMLAGQLILQAKVTNLSGHKLPTGYAEGRQMWLEVVVRDGADTLLFQSGSYDDATATLNADPQLRTYEVRHGIWDSGSLTCKTTDGLGREMFHFVLADCIASDTRIPPLRLRPVRPGDPGGLELNAVGRNYPPIAPGVLSNVDVAGYTVPLPAGSVAPFQVTARLRYQTASRAYAEFLRDQAIDHTFPSENLLCTGGPGRPFTVGPQNDSRGVHAYALWQKYGRSPPEDMADAAMAVP